MSDPAGVLSRYEDVCEELEVKPCPFIVKVLDKEREDQIVDQKEHMEIELPGNNYLLTKDRLTDSEALQLYKTLTNNLFVVGLDLRYNNITDDGAKHLGKLLEETCALRSLSVMMNDIGPDGAGFIAEGLQMNDTLLSLKMTGNKIGYKGGMALAGALQINRTLEELDVGDTDQETKTMIAFATILNFNRSLKAFCINRPLLFSQQEETTIHFSKMLKVNTTLTELHLRKCDLRDFGAERLAETLVENKTLKYLDLASNHMRRDGAKSLAKILKEDTALEILDIGANCIEDDGAIFLSEALATTNTHLKTLVITNNSINAPGLCAIAAAMSRNPIFNSVFIWGNNHEEAACVAFNDLIEAGKLDLKDTDVKPYIVDGRVYLAELSHGLRRYYYWTPFYGEDAGKDT